MTKLHNGGMKVSRKKPLSKKRDKKQSTKTLKHEKIKIGQTLESNDLYLPHDKSTKSKKRPVIVVDKNSREELVIVPGSTQKTDNTTEYKKYGIKYYRHNIEIEDDEGRPIKHNNKFIKNEKCTILPEREAQAIKDKVINHSKFASENRQKLSKFKNRYKKSKK